MIRVYVIVGDGKYLMRYPSRGRAEYNREKLAKFGTWRRLELVRVDLPNAALAGVARRGGA